MIDLIKMIKLNFSGKRMLNRIAADYYLFGDKKYTSAIPLYSDLYIFTEVAAVGEETPVLRIVLHENVPIQRLISALAFRKLDRVYKILESK